jgi:hypothetical protein
MQKPCPLTLGIEALIAMNPIKLADQSVNGAAVDLPQGTATNRT